MTLPTGHTDLVAVDVVSPTLAYAVSSTNALLQRLRSESAGALAEAAACRAEAEAARARLEAAAEGVARETERAARELGAAQREGAAEVARARDAAALRHTLQPRAPPPHDPTASCP